MLLVARSRLVSQRQATANTIRGLLKTFGLVVARGSKGLFPVRVREQIAGNPALIAIIEPLLAVWYAIREQVTMLDRQIDCEVQPAQFRRRDLEHPLQLQDSRTSFNRHAFYEMSARHVNPLSSSSSSNSVCAASSGHETST